jgi:dimethylamine/trimethylamine dehydrogenase
MVGDERPPGERVLVYDCEGYYMGAGIAEKLALDGYKVELVTPLEVIAPFCDETLEGPLLRKRLHDRGVGLHTGRTIEAIDSGGATGETDAGAQFELETDAVVLVTQRLSNEALYLELRAAADAWADEGVEAVYRIGDCVAPRVVAEVIFDGHRLAREIDSENPAVPLPHRRERPVGGGAT